MHCIDCYIAVLGMSVHTGFRWCISVYQFCHVNQLESGPSLLSGRPTCVHTPFLFVSLSRLAYCIDFCRLFCGPCSQSPALAAFTCTVSFVTPQLAQIYGHFLLKALLGKDCSVMTCVSNCVTSFRRLLCLLQGLITLCLQQFRFQNYLAGCIRIAVYTKKLNQSY